jgi:hypothetical protein
MKSLQVFYDSRPELGSLIRSVTYLIRQARFRPTHGVCWSDMRFLVVRPLGELLDMFHAHQATERHDKLFALLGMGSDAQNVVDLFPDYNVPWGKVFRRLINFLLGEGIRAVETWDDREKACFKSRGCILGQVTTVLPAARLGWNDTQEVSIALKDTAIDKKHDQYWEQTWKLHTSAVPVQRDDLLCLLPGTLKPLIIRRCGRHFDVIVITVDHPWYIRTSAGVVAWSDIARAAKFSRHDIQFVWDWEDCSNGRDGFHQEPDPIPGIISIRADDMWTFRKVPYDFGQDSHAREVSSAAIRRLLLDLKQNTFAITAEVVTEVASRLGVDIINLLFQPTGETVQSTTALISDVIDNNSGAGKVESLLLYQRKKSIIDTERVFAELAKFFDEEFFELFLELGGDRVPITEAIIRAAASNRDYGKTILLLLFKRRPDAIPNTESVVTELAKHFDKDVMELFLELKGHSILITERVLQAATSNPSYGVDSLLRTKAKLSITAAGISHIIKTNIKSSVMLLLHRRHFTLLTEASAIEIARRFDAEVVNVLLMHEGNSIIKEGLFKAAAENEFYGVEVMTLLLGRRGDALMITNDVVEEAERNPWCAAELMDLLLSHVVALGTTRGKVHHGGGWKCFPAVRVFVASLL